MKRVKFAQDMLHNITILPIVTYSYTIYLRGKNVQAQNYQGYEDLGKSTEMIRYREV